MNDMLSRMGNILKAEVSAVFSKEDNSAKPEIKQRATKIRDEFTNLKELNSGAIKLTDPYFRPMDETRALSLLGLDAADSVSQVQKAYLLKVKKSYPLSFSKENLERALVTEKYLNDLKKALEFLELKYV